jgi:hypothetical protein
MFLFADIHDEGLLAGLISARVVFSTSRPDVIPILLLA